ncbi:MAG: trypsin-like serine protease [Paracoccaceae bacterium]
MTILRHPIAMIVLFAFFVLLAPAVRAQNTGQNTGRDTGLEKLDTWGLNRGWEGVGFLNIDNRASCTGTMIRPDLVLTAAHCLYDGRTGERMDPRKIEFRAGWRSGKSIARRFGLRAVIHPSYDEGADDKLSSQQIRHDIALLQLADPIPSTHADPFRTDRGVATGNAVSIVSYGKGRNDAPSRQRECRILDSRSGVLAMSCDVVPGSSGAPVFAMREGRPRIVAVVSAIGKVEGRDVSFAMDIERPLSEALTALRSGNGVFPAAVTSARRLSVGGERSAGGARFIKP